jgi:hypothetical protein
MRLIGFVGYCWAKESMGIKIRKKPHKKTILLILDPNRFISSLLSKFLRIYTP